MRIVAIETSGRRGSVAALRGEGDDARPLQQIALGGDQRTAQALAPAMHDLLAQVDWTPQSVELVAIAVGPGSFTGLRIGVTTAKTFAYAVGAEIIGVNTLAVMAAQVRSKLQASHSPLWTILDAQRQELFVAKFVGGDRGDVAIDCETSIVGQEAWLTQLQPGDQVVGPPLRTLKSRLASDVIAMPEELWQPMATAVGRVGWRAYQSGRRDDVWKLVPQYYRASAAEEKAARNK
jgi:tRNA threonylcarbamoyladenosine biosynthesis protein TsaB